MSPKIGNPYRSPALMDWYIHIINWVSNSAMVAKRSYILETVKFINNVLWSFQKKYETWNIRKSCLEIFCRKSWGSYYPLYSSQFGVFEVRIVDWPQVGVGGGILFQFLFHRRGENITIIYQIICYFLFF